MASLIEEAVKLDVNRTMLNACNNFVEVIPASIAKLTKLKRFSAYDNALVELPPEIGELMELRYLNVRFNRLQCLPPEIGSLSQLRELHVEANRLTTLPVEVGKLSNLLKLDLRCVCPETHCGMSANPNPGGVFWLFRAAHPRCCSSRPGTTC